MRPSSERTLEWSEADGRMDPDATIRRQVLVEQARHGDGKYNGGTKALTMADSSWNRNMHLQ